MRVKRTIAVLALLAVIVLVVLASGRKGGEPADLKTVDMRDRFVYRDAGVSGHMAEDPVWAGNDHVVFAGADGRVYLWDLHNPPQVIGTYTRRLCSFADGRVRWTEKLWGGEGGSPVMGRYVERFPDGRLEAHDATFGPEHIWSCTGYIKVGHYRAGGGDLVWSSLSGEATVLERPGQSPMTMPFSGLQVGSGCMHYVVPEDLYLAFQCHNHPKQACARYWVVRPGARTVEEGCLPLPPRAEGIGPHAIARVFWTSEGFVVELRPLDKLRPNLWFFDTEYHQLDAGVATGVTVSPDGAALTYGIVPSIAAQFNSPIRPIMRVIVLDRGVSVQAK